MKKKKVNLGSKLTLNKQALVVLDQNRSTIIKGGASTPYATCLRPTLCGSPWDTERCKG